jgi:hypothetical protein
MGRQFKRTCLWIDPPLQARLLLRMALYLLLHVAFVWHIAFIFQAMTEVATDGPGPGLGGLYVEALRQQKFLLLALALTLPIILYDLLKFSNRIAGPLYRCRKVMQQMAAGQPVPEFTPRQHDQLGEFFQTFNALIKAWNARLAAGANGQAANGGAAETAGGEKGPPAGNPEATGSERINA